MIFCKPVGRKIEEECREEGNLSGHTAWQHNRSARLHLTPGPGYLWQLNFVIVIITKKSIYLLHLLSHSFLVVYYFSYHY